MSSIVSRRPEEASDLGSEGSPMNHRKEAFWISIRLGTSSTFSSLEKVRRLLGAWVLAGKASPPEGLEGGFKRRGTGPTAQPRRVSARQVPRKRGRGRRLPQGILMGNSTCRGVPLQPTIPRRPVRSSQLRGERNEPAQRAAAIVAARPSAAPAANDGPT